MYIDKGYSESDSEDYDSNSEDEGMSGYRKGLYSTFSLNISRLEEIHIIT